jgi:triosephosphate isomerase (TIM)
MTNKLKYFIGNWKMFGDFGSLKIIHKINKYSTRYRNVYNIKIILCVPNTLISFFNKKIKSKNLFLGAQNCHHNNSYGPFTGSVNSAMLKKVGAQYIILGHSENRSEGETDKLIKKKVISALNQKLNIILCLGEKKKDKINGRTFLILRKQIKNCLNKNLNASKIIIAYEPVWSIGTNKIPKEKDLRKTIIFIKKEIKKIVKSKNSIKVLYGGSVNPKNISLFSKINEIDGFLIGGASQSSKKFIDIIKNYYK